MIENERPMSENKRPTTENKWFWFVVIPFAVGVAVINFTDWYRRWDNYGKPPEPITGEPHLRSPKVTPDNPAPQPRTGGQKSTKYPLPLGADTQAFISCLASRSQHLYEGTDYRVVTISSLIRYLAPLIDEETFSIAYENCRMNLRQN